MFIYTVKLSAKKKMEKFERMKEKLKVLSNSYFLNELTFGFDRMNSRTKLPSIELTRYHSNILGPKK